MGEGWKAKGSCNVVLVGDGAIRDLNRRFLKRDHPTDVLAFPLGDGGEGIWGEVYVSEDRAREQAARYGVSFREELARLVVHGVLHLMGYDDKDEGSRKVMREREDHYLVLLGIRDERESI